MIKASVVLALLFATVTASAQDPWEYRDRPRWDRSWNDRTSPRAGACFFTDSGYRGNRFCVRAGDRLPSLPGDFGDNISSVQVFGRARVMVYNDRDFRGGNTELRGSVDDLRKIPFRGGHTWTNRISSIVIR